MTLRDLPEATLNGCDPFILLSLHPEATVDDYYDMYETVTGETRNTSWLYRDQNESDLFESKYKPQENHLHPEQGTLYETYGEDLEYVRKKAPRNRVWTLIEGEDNHLYWAAGFHYEIGRAHV